MSPRSSCLNCAYASSPTASTATRSWMRPVASCSVAKLALPMTRLSISRPATETATACCSSAALSRWPWRRASSAARSFGLKSFGNATPRARIAASFSRRSATSALSSAAAARGVPSGVVLMDVGEAASGRPRVAPPAEPSGSAEADDPPVEEDIEQDEEKEEDREDARAVPPEDARDDRQQAEHPQIWRRHRVALRAPALADAWPEVEADQAAVDERVQMDAVGLRRRDAAQDPPPVHREDRLEDRIRAEQQREDRRDRRVAHQ